jgi:Na+/H+ antiporter NhaD/arsenite permease-like protein
MFCLFVFKHFSNGQLKLFVPAVCLVSCGLAAVTDGPILLTLLFPAVARVLQAGSDAQSSPSPLIWVAICASVALGGGWTLTGSVTNMIIGSDIIGYQHYLCFLLLPTLLSLLASMALILFRQRQVCGFYRQFFFFHFRFIVDQFMCVYSHQSI